MRTKRYFFIEKSTGTHIDVIVDLANDVYYASEIHLKKFGCLAFVPFRVVDKVLCEKEMEFFRNHPELYVEGEEK